MKKLRDEGVNNFVGELDRGSKIREFVRKRLGIRHRTERRDADAECLPVPGRGGSYRRAGRRRNEERVIVRFGKALFLGILLLGAGVTLWLCGIFGEKREPDSRKSAHAVSEAGNQELVIDFPKNWIEIPGKLSRTYRSPRPGAGLLQLSVHPALAGRVDGPRAEKELDALLREMVCEMDFGRRLEIGYWETKAGALAFAKYQSPAHGVLGFWLLAAEPMIFATYVDGGSSASETDIREAQQAFREARRE